LACEQALAGRAEKELGESKVAKGEWGGVENPLSENISTRLGI